MQKFTFNFYASVTALAVGLIALVVLGFQQVQATTQGKV
ncbi:MAG: Na+/H+ antiporter NhaC, partial [Acidimicrobiales bacterium]